MCYFWKAEIGRCIYILADGRNSFHVPSLRNIKDIPTARHPKYTICNEFQRQEVLPINIPHSSLPAFKRSFYQRRSDRRGRGGDGGEEGEDVAQLRVIYEAPTMDNGASCIRQQPAERSGLCYVAFYIPTNEYAHNTGNNLCISWPCNGRLVRRQVRVRSQRNSCEESGSGRMRLKCDGTRAETRFRLSAKRTSPFKSAGGVSSVDYWQPRCAHQW